MSEQHPQALIDAVRVAVIDNWSDASGIARAAITAYEQYRAAHLDPAPEPVGDGTGNDLIDLMHEFGVKAELLGVHEEPSPDGLALGDMLLEIHQLRQRLAQRPGAGVINEELVERMAVAYYQPNDWDKTCESFRDEVRTGIRQAIAAAVAQAEGDA